MSSFSLKPVALAVIIGALEREAATQRDPSWRAAQELRHLAGWQDRTLMCEVEDSPQPAVQTRATSFTTTSADAMIAGDADARELESVLAEEQLVGQERAAAYARLRETAEAMAIAIEGVIEGLLRPEGAGFSTAALHSSVQTYRTLVPK